MVQSRPSQTSGGQAETPLSECAQVAAHCQRPPHASVRPLTPVAARGGLRPIAVTGIGVRTGGGGGGRRAAVGGVPAASSG